MTMLTLPQSTPKDRLPVNSGSRGQSPESPGGRALRKGDLWTWKLAPGQRLELRGRLGHGWVTMEGEMEDRVLSPGSLLGFIGPGLVLLEALQDGVVFECRPG